MGWFRNQAPFWSGETTNWFYHGLQAAWTNTGSNQVTPSLQPRGSFNNKYEDWRSFYCRTPNWWTKTCTTHITPAGIYHSISSAIPAPSYGTHKASAPKFHRIRRLCACPSWSWLPHNSTLLEQRRSSTRKDHVSTQRLTWH